MVKYNPVDVIIFNTYKHRLNKRFTFFKTHIAHYVKEMYFFRFLF